MSSFWNYDQEPDMEEYFTPPSSPQKEPPPIEQVSNAYPVKVEQTFPLEYYFQDQTQQNTPQDVDDFQTVYQQFQDSIQARENNTLRMQNIASGLLALGLSAPVVAHLLKKRRS